MPAIRAQLAVERRFETGRGEHTPMLPAGRQRADGLWLLYDYFLSIILEKPASDTKRTKAQYPSSIDSHKTPDFIGFN